jgi:hypothetical protein
MNSSLKNLQLNKNHNILPQMMKIKINYNTKIKINSKINNKINKILSNLP